MTVLYVMHFSQHCSTLDIIGDVSSDYVCECVIFMSHTRGGEMSGGSVVGRYSSFVFMTSQNQVTNINMI